MGVNWHDLDTVWLSGNWAMLKKTKLCLNHFKWQHVGSSGGESMTGGRATLLAYDPDRRHVLLGCQ